MRAFADYVQNLWRGEASTFADRLMLLLLYLPSACYGGVMRVRAWCYRHGIFRVYRLPRPVISVGNLTVGGTGKTPVTAWIARYLIAKGLRVVVLSRGYGGSREGQVAIVSDGDNLLLSADQCGDEPYLLASAIPGLMVVIGSNRHQAGLLAMERLRPDVFLLDDGYQHLRLHRDLNILLMDCGHPFGNGRVLPAGPLREPAEASRRANLGIVTRCHNGQVPDCLPHGTMPFCRVDYKLASFNQLCNGCNVDLSVLQQAKVIAFAGIAHPHTYFTGLRNIGIHPVETLALPDHEPYGYDMQEQLRQLATAHAADWLLTTEKDGVKLQDILPDLAPKIVTACLELHFFETEPLEVLLNELSLCPREG